MSCRLAVEQKHLLLDALPILYWKDFSNPFPVLSCIKTESMGLGRLIIVGLEQRLNVRESLEISL